MKWTGELPKPPRGTWGVAVQLQESGAANRATIAVAAKWNDPSAPVLALKEHGAWRYTGKQVADYRHNPYVALACEVAAYWAMTGVATSKRRYTRYVNI